MSKKLPREIERFEVNGTLIPGSDDTTETSSPTSGSVLDNSGSGGDEETVGDLDEANELPPVSPSLADTVSVEDTSSDTLENEYQQKEGSMSPEYPSSFIEFNTNHSDVHRPENGFLRRSLASCDTVQSLMPRKPSSNDDDEYDLYESIRIPEIQSTEDNKVSRKRRADEDNDYFEIDWDDELRADGHLPPPSRPSSLDDDGISMDTHRHFLDRGDSPNHRCIQKMELGDLIPPEQSPSPHYRSNYDDIIHQQRESAKLFASKLKQKLEEVPMNRSLENVNDAAHDLSSDANLPFHPGSRVKHGSFIAINKNDRIVPCIYIGEKDYAMEVEMLTPRKIGWVSSKIKCIVPLDKFICLLKNVEPQPQPKSKSSDPIKVLIFSESLF